MKREEYMHYMDKIQPTEEMDLRMSKLVSVEENASQKAGTLKEHGRRKRTGKAISQRGIMWKPAVLFMALLLFFVPVTVFADDIRAFFGGIFIKDSGPAREDVRENVFTDEDEHVRIEVKEAVADRRFVAAIIKYEALDDYGREWMETAEWEENKEWDAMSIEGMNSHVRNGLFDLGMDATDSYNSERRDLKEYNTETERYYIAYSKSALGSETGIQSLPRLNYKLCDGEKSTVLNVDFAKEYTYLLKGDSLMGGEINPVMLEISDLHFRMEAEYGEASEDAPYDLADSMSTIAVHSVVFRFEDGTEVEVADEEIDICGLAGSKVYGRRLLAAGKFFNWFKMHELTEWYGEEKDLTYWFLPVKPDKVTGVEIDGNYYEVERVNE